MEAPIFTLPGIHLFEARTHREQKICDIRRSLIQNSPGVLPWLRLNAAGYAFEWRFLKRHPVTDYGWQPPDHHEAWIRDPQRDD